MFLLTNIMVILLFIIKLQIYYFLLLKTNNYYYFIPWVHVMLECDARPDLSDIVIFCKNGL